MEQRPAEREPVTREDRPPRLLDRAACRARQQSQKRGCSRIPPAMLRHRNRFGPADRPFPL
ncbi:hypothetical protein BCV70DRAFT_13188 [Testicularia cyperi]|uniref:Uncharacterized protein n=1 Tax=Testicularia cyperi TaxID=1882483 RepID=A0A317Y0X1_9BASI|nr:hypothetical protein BCV70DRAFT_13188 [Testicularia cyperi]